VSDVLKLIGSIIGEHIQIELSVPSKLDRVRGDEGQIEQVVLNLCLNARDAMPQGGKLRISLRNVRLKEDELPSWLGLKPGPYVEIDLSDTGRGMDEETKARIFEPFFTTKPVGQGTGLGLPVVQGIVQQHEGFISVESKPGEGTLFRVHLPSISSEPGDLAGAAKPEPPGADARFSGCETVLLAEDDPDVRLSAQSLLSRHGYRVILACDGEEACQIAATRLGAIEIMVFDVVMPRLGGIAAAQRILSMKPGLPVILCSGYADGLPDTDGLPDSGWKLVHKPYRGDELLAEIRASLEALHKS
jgi:CheY-like chemotaxis protein